MTARSGPRGRVPPGRDPRAARGLWWRRVAGGLSFRLTAAFLLVALVGIAVASVATGVTVARRFDVYLGRYQRLRAEQVATMLEEAYRRGGPEALVAEADKLAAVAGLYGRLVDDRGVVLWARFPRGYGAPGGMGHGPRWRDGSAAGQHALPLVVDGEPVATLYVAVPPGVQRAGEELAFLGGVRRSLWLGGALAALVAVAVGLAVARSISRPLLGLKSAAERLRRGELELEVPERGSDEMVELARAFNLMVRSLARQRELRRNLAADVAHELRTPLAVVRGHIEALQDGVWEVTPENLAALHAEIMRLVRLVGELEKLNEAESGALELVPAEVDLGQLARRVVAAFGPSFERAGVDVELEVEEGVRPVWGDGDRLSQVVWNLLSNALKFTPRGGRVAVRVFGSPARPTRGAGPAAGRKAEGRAGRATAEGCVCLSVTDTGPGIPPEDLPYVFERFFRGRPRAGAAEEVPGDDRTGDRQGEGLGLAISQALARAHGGRIEVESEPGRGTTFTLVLPALAGTGAGGGSV